MKSTKKGNILFCRLEIGEDINESLLKLADEWNVKTGIVQGIGACDKVGLMVYDVEKKDYDLRDYTEFMEMVSLNGNITRMDNKAHVHLHAAFGRENLKAIAGHLDYGVISATAEIIITIVDTELTRFHEKETGLNLWEI